MLTRRRYNVFHVGLGFLILFSADFTLNSIQKLINTSITRDNPDYSVDGYVVLALIYLTFGVTFVFAPSIISFLGCRTTMVVGTLAMGLYFMLFSLEIPWVTYVGTIITGMGGSILWVAEGQYIVQNAHDFTLSSDVSLFWATFIASMSAGNILTTIKFAHLTQIDKGTRSQICYIIAGMSAIALLVFALTGKPKGSLSKKTHLGPVESLCKMYAISRTKNIATLLMTFIFVGFQQSFGWGIYATCVGFTEEFGDIATQLVPMTALVYGLGGCTGGIVNIFLQRWTVYCRKRYIIYVGFAIELICFLGAVINLPNSSVFAPTKETSVFIKPKLWLALCCAFGLGICDSCLNTQIYTLIGLLHPDSSSQAVSVYKLVKSLAVAGFYLLSLVMGLHVQALFMTIVGLVGVACFRSVDARVEKVSNVF